MQTEIQCAETTGSIFIKLFQFIFNQDVLKSFNCKIHVNLSKIELTFYTNFHFELLIS